MECAFASIVMMVLGRLVMWSSRLVIAVSSVLSGIVDCLGGMYALAMCMYLF